MTKRSAIWHSILLGTIVVISSVLIGKAELVQAENKTSVANRETIKPLLADPDEWILTYHDEFDGTELSDMFIPKLLPYWNTNTPRYEVQTPVYDGKLHLQIDNGQPDFLDVPGVTANGFKVSGVMGGMRDFVHMNHYGLEIQDHYLAEDKYVTKYGYFEIRAKMQRGGGMAPAWWMVGFQDDKLHTAEIDIFEVPGNDPTTLYFSLHAWDDPKLENVSLPVQTGIDLSADFHTYGFEWDPQYIRLYIDGVQKAQINQSPDYRMMTILSLNQHENNPWLGPLDTNLPNPKDFQIDYYRAFKKVEQLEGENEQLPSDDLIYGVNLAETAYASISNYSVAQYKMNPPYLLNDGDSRTGIFSKEDPDFPQYIYLDWTTPKTFDTVGLSCSNCLEQGPTNWEVQLSDDGISNWTTVAAVSDMQWAQRTEAIETEELRFAVAKNKKHLRIKINDAHTKWGQFSINEIQVRLSNNIAWHASVAADGFDMTAEGSNLTHINDGLDDSALISTQNPQFPQYIYLTWEEARSFESITIKCQYCKKQAPTSWEVEVSEDGIADWTVIASSGNIVWQGQDERVEAATLSFARVSDKKGLRVKVSDAKLHQDRFAVNEIEVYSNNLALAAKGSGTGLSDYSKANLINMNDGDDTTGIVSVENPSMPHYIVLRWEAGQSFSHVSVKCKFCQGQGLKNWLIEVSEDGESGWQTLASSGDVAWQSNTSDTELKTISFSPVSNKKGMRLKVNSAYLDWGHYAVYEITVN